MFGYLHYTLLSANIQTQYMAQVYHTVQCPGLSRVRLAVFFNDLIVN